MNADLERRIAASVQVLAERAPGLQPRVAIVLGSGWDGAAERVDSPIDVAYRDLPAFPALGVGGHAGVLRLGRLAGREVALLRGRAHAYETGDAAAMKGAIGTLAALGVRTLVLTCAAGSLHPSMPPGSLMLVADHLNLVQRSPLVGERDDARFVDLAEAYDPTLRQLAHDAAQALGSRLHEGVYAWMLGPQFETPAEIRMLQRLGADAVGMSLVPETILARHAGLAVLGLAMITNLGCGLQAGAIGHAHTLAAARRAAPAARALLERVVAALDPPA